MTIQTLEFRPSAHRGRLRIRGGRTNIERKRRGLKLTTHVKFGTSISIGIRYIIIIIF